MKGQSWHIYAAPSQIILFDAIIQAIFIESSVEVNNPAS